MTDDKKILVVFNSDFKLSEINSGAALRNNMFLRALAEVGHVDVICFSEDNAVSNIPNSNVIYSKRYIDTKDFWEAVRSLICMAVWPANPYSYYRYNKHKAAIVKGFLKNAAYDMIACRYVDTAVKYGLLNYKERLVIDLDDNLSAVRQSEALQTSSKIKSWKKLYEAKRLKKMLRRICEDVHCTFCSNLLELPSPRTIYLHNTTLLGHSSTCIAEPLRPRILFVGWLDYYPNKQGIKHFSEVIFPQIKSAIPIAELRIVGEGKRDLIDYLNGLDGVDAVGRVDNLAEEYNSAAVVVIPIYCGSGTSVKFVEALFMKRPVISTHVGARGYSDVCCDGKDCMLASADEEFAEKTIELLSSVTKAGEIANNGFEKAKTYFSQDKFIAIVKKALY